MALAAGLVLSACGGGGSYSSSQAKWSDLSDADRANLRDVMNKFNGTGISNINVLSVLGVVADEGRRFAGALSSSYVIDLPTLDLTDAKILPELDANGNFDTTGGYREYSEVKHNPAGAVASDTKVHQRERAFTKGKLAFKTSLTTDSPSQDYFGQGMKFSGTLSDDLEYTQTAWWQQKEYTTINGGVQHNEVFKYQSQPLWKTTIKTGGTWDSSSESQDWIYSTTGFKTQTVGKLSSTLEGTYDRWMPKEIPANGNAVQNSNPQTSGSTTTDKITTIVPDPAAPQPPPVPVPGVPELQSVTVIATTTDLVRTTGTCAGGDDRNESIVWRTTTVKYSVAPGMADQARRNRSLETHKDYAVTTKLTTLETNVCNGANWTKEQSVVSLKYTDNPANRNDVAGAWRSTKTSTTTTFDNGSGTFTVIDHGTEWLLGELVSDPEITAAAWKAGGSSESKQEVVENYFGDDKSGVETNTTVTMTANLSRSWKGTDLSVSGTVTTRTATIDAPNAAAHTQTGDGDGSLSLTLGGKTTSVSAEEWSTIQ